MLIVVIGLKLATNEKHYYDSAKTDSCPNGYITPFTVDSRHIDKPFFIGGESSLADMQCSFSPYYWIAVDLLWALVTILVITGFWTFCWQIYKKWLINTERWKKFLFWFLVSLWFVSAFSLYVLYWLFVFNIDVILFSRGGFMVKWLN